MAIVEITTDNFEQLIAAHSFMIIDFWADWCAPCKSFKLIFEAVAEQYPDITFASCDIEANEEIAQDFAIQSVPHVMILREQIAVYDESGLLDKEALVDLLQQAKALDMAALREQLKDQSS